MLYSEGDGIIAPVAYSPAWLILSFLLLAVVIASILLVKSLTYRYALRRALAGTVSDLEALKAEFLRATADVSARVAGGECTARRAHQELTGILRMFLLRATGVDVSSGSLAQVLADPRNRPVGEAIAWLYEPDFAADSDRQIEDSLRRVREVIRQWR
ncbi:hypothetical protein ACUH95_00445 [Dermabacteraceae bacterium P13101]